MAVAKNTPTSGSMSTVGAFASQLMAFAGGKIYIGAGSYANRTAFNAVVSDLTVLATELSSNYDELSDIAEKPGKIESKVNKLKTKHFVKDGKRTTKIELHIGGISEDRMSFIDKDLNKSDQTIILVDENGTSVMCFNGLRWSGGDSGNIDEVFDTLIETEFSGPRADKMWIAENIQPAA